MDQLRDLPNSAILGQSAGPQLISTTGGGSTVDFLQGDGQVSAIQSTGARSSETTVIAGKLQESVDGNTWTDIAGATFANVTADNITQAISCTRTKRYVRWYRTLSGTSPGAICSVVLIELKKQIGT